MKAHFISVVTGLSIVFIFTGLVIGSIPWGVLTASIFGFSIAELLRYRRLKKGEEVDAPNDDRVLHNLKHFAAVTLFLSQFLLFIYLVIAKYASGLNNVNVDYLIIYVVAIFFILLTGGTIVERR
ncbi:hypothetical protein U0355_09535 [Salimicrobium sp. PL1-032A]|uniref:hypothetical protein n=1 Tax=Salimicrobium sp. PL1-032A TaxID=3095364 RepID=UPI0032617FA8